MCELVCECVCVWLPLSVYQHTHLSNKSSKQEEMKESHKHMYTRAVGEIHRKQCAAAAQVNQDTHTQSISSSSHLLSVNKQSMTQPCASKREPMQSEKR